MGLLWEKQEPTTSVGALVEGAAAALVVVESAVIDWLTNPLLRADKEREREREPESCRTHPESFTTASGRFWPL